MGFRQDARFVKVWEIEDKGNYHVVSLSTSKKNRDTDKYETDFNSKFVRFIGAAHTEAANLKAGDSIKLGSCEVTNHYDKEKKVEYTNYLVYSFEKENGGNSNNNNSAPAASNNGFVDVSDVTEDELPFN